MQWNPQAQEVADLLTRMNEKPLEIETYEVAKASIALALLREQPANTELTYATIGLSLLSLQNDKGESVGLFKLIVPSFAEDTAYRKVIDQVIQQILETRSIGNTIFLNAMEAGYPDLKMKHIYLVSPYFWEPVWEDGGEIIHVNGKRVRWLQVTPISEAEYRFGEEHGYDELENLLVSHDVDAPEINRESVV